MKRSHKQEVTFVLDRFEGEVIYKKQLRVEECGLLKLPWSWTGVIEKS